MKVTRWAAVPVLMLSVAACGSDGDSSGSSGDWCKSAVGIKEQFDGIGAAFQDPSSDLKALFGELVPALDEAVDDAPSEIKDDVKATQEAIGKVDALLKDADYQLIDLDLGEMQSIMTDQSVADANDRIEAYNQKECGIEPDSTVETADSVADSIFSGTARDQILTSLKEIGLTDEEATCVSGQIDDDLAASMASDPTQVMQILTDCGLDAARLAELGPTGS